MTARHQLRLGKRLGRERSAFDATAAPPVGETLQLARERKGIDLYRAERDTKIRLRYLAALEDGDWNELPAPVYTKGFLRNYAIYLGLEPDDILDRWRDEMEQLRTATRVAVAPPPMPLIEPGGRHFTLSPGIIVGALLVVVIVAFVGYLGVQFMRFVDVTEIGLVYPPNVVSVIDAQQVTLQGTAGRGALISITGPDGQLYNTTTDQLGTWNRSVPLTRGRNNFTIVATDPVTQRESKSLQLTITVPLASASPGATATVAPPPPITMTLFGPPDGYTATDRNVIVSGTTTGTRITVTSTYVGAPPATAPPPPTAVASGLVVPSPSAPRPSTSAPPPPAGPTADITVPSGSFSQALTFPVGTWRVTVTAGATGLAPVSHDVQIVVQPPTVPAIHLSILVSGKQTTLKVTADGVPVPELDGIKVTDGQTYSATAWSEFCVRSANASKLSLTLDGTPLGLLSGQAGSWIIKPGQSPQLSSSPC